jgi:hypothetical protein
MTVATTTDGWPRRRRSVAIIGASIALTAGALGWATVNAPATVGAPKPSPQPLAITPAQAQALREYLRAEQRQLSHVRDDIHSARDEADHLPRLRPGTVRMPALPPPSVIPGAAPPAPPAPARVVPAPPPAHATTGGSGG